MNGEAGLLDALIELVRILLAASWSIFALLLDWSRTMGPLRAAGVVVAMLVIALATTALMQGRLNRTLSAHPERDINLFLHELIFTLPGLMLGFFLLPFWLAYRLAKRIVAVGQSVSQRRQKRQESDAEVDPRDSPSRLEDAPTEEEAPREPVLVASIAPSLLGAAVLCALLYLLGLVTDPLVALQLDLSEGLSAWEFLLLGDRPELQWYVPLARFPWMAGALTALFWGVIWWWAARIIRLVYHKELGANLISRKKDAAILTPWRGWFGAPELWRPSGTYTRWARWLPMLGAPLLLLSWLSLSSEPYRMSPSMFSISLLLLFSWGAHFLIEGVLRDEEEEEHAARERELVMANTWGAVLDDVKKRFHLRPPHIFVPPRIIEPLALSSIDPSHEGVISPLLTELLPEPRSLTHMQYVVLRSLSLLGYVHTDPPSPRRELDLGAASPGQLEEATARHRSQIVLAPEGAGKSTLAMLAACNHAIIHTRATLIITRDDERAQAVYHKLKQAIEPSTLRWNIRERRVGADLVTDLAQGIIPDIIVCSLRQLVINILDETQTYTPFLQNVGLVIIDDVESFCGAVEAHAQLAVRRLMLRLEHLLGVPHLGKESAPMLLALGTDSMHDTPAWVRTLCGVDAVARYFDYSNEEAELREEALKAYQGIASGNSPESNKKSEDGFSGSYQLIYRLDDFRDADGESLDVRDLIESCERLAVPWHYRPCGDDRRHLGRQRLHLRDEPRYHVHSPLDAGVIFLQGHWAEVQREIARLKRAGAHFDPVKRAGEIEEELGAQSARVEKKGRGEQEVAIPIALVTIIDRDEEMALTEMNVHSSLTSVLATLPRPVVRAPQGRAVLEHLSSEITSNWVEVKDVLDIFGNPVSRVLGALADAGMLMSEERVDLDPDVQLYEHKVFVRATSRAQASSSRVASTSLLPPRVAQVELPSGEKIAIRDRTNLNLIDTADAASAPHVFYIGRIFENALGRFVVVGHGARDEESEDRAMISRDVLVEPYLGDGLSSPRRRVWIYHCDEHEALRRHHTPYHPAMTARCSHRDELPVAEPILIGDHPVATAISPVTSLIDHIATYRLGEKIGEVRQRILFDPKQRKESLGALRTMAMALYPNPSAEALRDDGEPMPMLRLEEARLIAAAMRAVLPSIYRGASFSVEVAIHVDAREPAPDHELAAHEGFYFFDPLPGGNGAARALHRDGPELLLRLCRVYIERVLYHDRLRARYDDWGDEAEIVSGQHESAPEEPGVDSTWFVDLDDSKAESGDEVGATNEEGAERRDALRQQDRELRRRTLIWLDSRLRPEGSLSGGRRSGTYGSGSEEGEGDLWDIGRCWYSRSGEVTDLLWTRHRWRLDDAGGEAMVDVGFDRDTAAASRFFHPGSPQLAPMMRALSEQLQNPAFHLSDQTVWGTPRPIWSAKDDSEIPVSSDGALALQQPARDLALFLDAIALHDYWALEPLARLLQERSWTDATTPQGRLALLDYVTRFVQGLPSTAPSSPRVSARPPIQALLKREGDVDSKSLLLAMLLRHCGFDTGLFVALEEQGGALCAVAVTEGGAGDGDAEQTRAALAQWRKMAGASSEPLLFAELPSRPGGPEAPLSLYVPIDVMRDVRPGRVRLDQPERWLFMPLVSAWLQAGVYEEQERLPAQEEEGS